VDERQSGGIGIRERPPGASCWVRGGERYVLLSVPIQIERDSLVPESVGKRLLQFVNISETVTGP
jgi:hypothetical protein